MQTHANSKAIFGFPDFWQEVYDAHRPFFEACFRLNDLSNQELAEAVKKAAEPVEKVVFLLVRITTIGMIELLTLAGNGAGPGAMKIARGMFESSTVSEYLRRNPQEAQVYLEFTHIIHWNRYQQLLKSSPDAAKKIEPRKVKELERNYNRARTRFMGSKGRIRNQWNKNSIAQMAREVGRSEQYETSYSLGASIHHANFEGALAYVQVQDANVTFDAPPSMAWIPEALIAGHICLLQALDTLNDCLKLGFDDKIKAAADEFKKVWSARP